MMQKNDYLKYLVEEIHSTTIATIGADGHPQTRVIDIMLWDEKYIALSAVKEKRSISLRGKIENIGAEKLNEIFEKNPYMQSIYPDDTRKALEVFRLYEAEGEYFDINDPSHVTRDSFLIGNAKNTAVGYHVNKSCIGCGRCYESCPQKCIDIKEIPAVIDQHRCLHCGQCAEVCPKKAVIKSAV